MCGPDQTTALAVGKGQRDAALAQGESPDYANSLGMNTYMNSFQGVAQDNPWRVGGQHVGEQIFQVSPGYDFNADQAARTAAANPAPTPTAPLALNPSGTAAGPAPSGAPAAAAPSFANPAPGIGAIFNQPGPAQAPVANPVAPRTINGVPTSSLASIFGGPASTSVFSAKKATPTARVGF